MNRIDRLSAILIQLQSRSLVRAKDIADRFNISLRTVYRDIKSLDESGVPIIGEAGEGYRLMDGYRLPPVMFNQEEATALITASKLVQSKTDAGISGHYNTAMDKIRAVLRTAEKDHIEGIDNNIAIMQHPSISYEPKKDLHLPAILRAIGSANVIEILYHSLEKKEQSKRMIEPIGIYYSGSHWYLIAWCRLRNDYRNFRTDKITALQASEEKITAQHPPLQQFISKMKENRELHEVVIDVERSVVKYLGEQKYYNGFVKEEEHGEHIRLTFLTASLMGFSRWFMLFGDHATIIHPASLTGMVKDIAEGILSRVSPRHL